MKSYLIVLFLILLGNTVSAQKIGIAKLLHPYTSSTDAEQVQQNFETIVAKYCNKRSVEYVFLYDNIRNDNSDKKYAIQKCKELHLDGIIVSRMKFVGRPTNITNNGRKLVETEHRYVEMDYIDNDGIIISSASKNTSDNDMNILPASQNTFKRAVGFCLEKILEEIYWEGPR